MTDPLTTSTTAPHWTEQDLLPSPGEVGEGIADSASDAASSAADAAGSVFGGGAAVLGF